MNASDFDSVVKNRIALIEKILVAKRAEYAPDGGDRLHNFNRAASMLGCSRERALIGMWTKHIISILDIVDGLSPASPISIPLVEEKIGDAINYLILLEAMLKERYEITKDDFLKAAAASVQQGAAVN